MRVNCHVSCWLVTIRDGSACLALQPQRWPEPGSVVEAPALLHFGRAPAHQFGAADHLVAGGTALAVVDGCMSALHALTARTRHPDPLLKAQLLAAQRDGAKRGQRREHFGARVMEVTDK